MSKLAVGSIEGLASEGYKITVPTGSKIVQAGAVLQVVSTAKTNTFTTASTSYVAITGLNATITPSATSSKILIMVQLSGAFYQVGSVAGFVRLRRDSTDIFIADAEGSREQITATVGQVSNAVSETITMVYLDSPSSTSALVYQPVIRGDGATLFVNRSSGDANSANNPRTASSITLMEIAG